MKRIIQLMILSVFLILSVNSQAGVIGLPESTLKIGFGSRVAASSVKSMYGETRDIVSVQPFNLIATDWFMGGLKYWVEAYTASYRFDPSQTQLGQQVKQNGMRVSLLANYKIAKYFNPWLGAGFDVARSTFTKRHTIDFEGFRADQFKDEAKLDVGMLFHVQQAWDLTKQWNMGVKGEYRLSFSESIQGSAMEMFLLYRY